MEESKELQGNYKIFRTVIYVSLLLEFFEYAIDPAVLDHWNGVLVEIHDRMKQWFIYMDGHIGWSKVATFLVVCVTCLGTKNKKSIEYDARKMVLYPIVAGFILTLLSITLFNHRHATPFYASIGLRLGTILYMIASIVGTVFIHIALDNISKFLREGLLKDRFNLENESFEQTQKKEENKYSVNIPMRYYYKGKFREGWVNIVNPFRGTK